MTARKERMARALLALDIMDAEHTTTWPAEEWIDRHWRGMAPQMRQLSLAEATVVLRYIGDMP